MLDWIALIPHALLMKPHQRVKYYVRAVGRSCRFPWSLSLETKTDADPQTRSRSCTDIFALKCHAIFCITSWTGSACVLSHVSSWSFRPKLDMHPTALICSSRWGISGVIRLFCLINDLVKSYNKHRFFYLVDVLHIECVIGHIEWLTFVLFSFF